MSEPEKRPDDVFVGRDMAEREKIAWMIEASGWAVVPVAPRRDTTPAVPGYSYTVGLTSTFGFCEVVVFGLTPVAARGIIGDVVGIVASGGEVPVGVEFVGLYDNGLRSALVALDSDAVAGIFPAADEWYGSTPYRVAQLMWPDRSGRFPWEPGFDRAMIAAQPVLGEW